MRILKIAVICGIILIVILAVNFFIIFNKKPTDKSKIATTPTPIMTPTSASTSAVVNLFGFWGTVANVDNKAGQGLITVKNDSGKEVTIEAVTQTKINKFNLFKNKPSEFVTDKLTFMDIKTNDRLYISTKSNVSGLVQISKEVIISLDLYMLN